MDVGGVTLGWEGEQGRVLLALALLMDVPATCGAGADLVTPQLLDLLSNRATTCLEQ
jgi:hypothetical protein